MSDSIYLVEGCKRLIIIPFADFKPEQKRAKQLKEFLININKLVSKNCNIQIVIAEQVLPFDYFNRGQLLNAGLKWFITEFGNPEFIIMHDVDMLPDKTLFNEYLEFNQPISLVPQDAEYRKKYGRINLSAGGGIFGLPFKLYIDANGYPNDLWNWGGEDDAFSKRLDKIHLNKFSRVRKGHIKHIDIQRKSHQSKMEYLRKNKIRSMMVHENLEKDNINWMNNGFKQLKINPKEVKTKGCIHHIKFELDNIGLIESIEHNEKIYKEL
jgi:hypothetical protein